MNQELMHGADVISLFCRLNINMKKDLPIRSSEMGLLMLTLQSEAPVTPAMAADFFKVKKPMITAMLKPLCRQGYLAKHPSSEDKRSFFLVPTEKAKQLAESEMQQYFRELALLQEKLGDDYTVMLGLLEQANKILLEDKQHG